MLSQKVRKAARNDEQLITWEIVKIYADKNKIISMWITCSFFLTDMTVT